MAKTKKDMLGQKMYTRLKKHPIAKNPILLFYFVSFFILLIGYIIYLIATETI